MRLFVNQKPNLKTCSKINLIIGGAGVGKSYTIREYVEKDVNKDILLLAPTGISAINIGGVTIHLCLGVSYKYSDDLYYRIDQIKPKYKRFNLAKDKKQAILSSNYIIIDEISMVRADLLDYLNTVMKKLTGIYDEPFGGYTVIMVGDPFQLPPVVTEKYDHKDKVFFFESDVFRNEIKDNFDVYLLTKNYRQSEEDFIQALNKVRLGICDNYVKEFFSDFATNKEINKDSVILTSLNKTSNQINKQELDKIQKEPTEIHAYVSGLFPEHMYPVPLILTLKPGAKVIMCRNIRQANRPLSETKYELCNGDICYVEDNINNEYVEVYSTRMKKNVIVHRSSFENYDRRTVGGKVTNVVIGEFIQIPLKLAYALTIHKCQGLTLDYVHILNSDKLFDTGQFYVALSRCRTKDGLSLETNINPNQVFVNPTVKKWYDFITNGGL